jgi:hypothetical protein
MLRLISPAPGSSILALLVLTSSFGCSASPVAPKVMDLTGTWTGALPFTLPDGGWTEGRLALVQSGSTIDGEIISRDNVRSPLSGTLAGSEAELIVGGLPGTSTCAGVSLIVTGFDFRGPNVQRLSGRAAGRCFGTVAGEFQLRRTG